MVAGTDVSRGRGLLIGDLPILARIVIVALVAAVAAGSAAVVGLTKLSSTAAVTQQLYRENMEPSINLGSIKTDVVTARFGLMNLAAAQNDAARDKATTTMTDATKAVEDLLDKYEPLAADPSAVKDLRAAWGKYLAFREATLVPLAKKGDLAEFAAQACPVVCQGYGSIFDFLWQPTELPVKWRCSPIG